MNPFYNTRGLRIGIDARMFLTPKSGIGQYVASLLRAFGEIESENEYYLYAPFPFNWQLPTGHFNKRIVPPRRGLSWMQYFLPKSLEKDCIDLFWGGNYVVPFMPRKLKKVATIHDLVFRRHPRTLPLRTNMHLRLAMPFYLYSCCHMLVDSYNTAHDLIKYYRVASNKLTVTHLAAGEKFYAEIDEKTIQSVLHKYGLSKGYLLFVGTIEPRKGVDTILKALSIYNKRNSTKLPFVVAGQLGWKTEKILALLKQPVLKKTVCLLDYVPDEDLPALYKGASIFLYPSVYEGFGLPVIEAMASGVPVITAKSSSLPEVAAEAALFIKPGDVGALCFEIEKLIGNKNLQQELIRRGKHQARKFSWQETARKTLQVFYNC